MEEVEALQISIHDGHFEATAQLRKAVLRMQMRGSATVRFVVESARLSQDEQWVVLQYLDHELRGEDILDKLVASIAKGLVYVMMGDPVAVATSKLPQVESVGRADTAST